MIKAIRSISRCENKYHNLFQNNYHDLFLGKKGKGVIDRH